jgi:hypothetical protein
VKIYTSLETYKIIKSKIHGKGLTSTIAYRKGDTIGLMVKLYNLKQEEVIFDNAELVSRNIKISKAGSLINHSENPNIKLAELKPMSWYAVAINDIPVGKELLANYNDTPWFIKKPDPSWV